MDFGFWIGRRKFLSRVFSVIRGVGFEDGTTYRFRHGSFEHGFNVERMHRIFKTADLCFRSVQIRLIRLQKRRGAKAPLIGAAQPRNPNLKSKIQNPKSAMPYHRDRNLCRVLLRVMNLIVRNDSLRLVVIPSARVHVAIEAWEV